MATPELDPVIHQPTRLQLMTYLYRNRQAAFTTLRDELGLTPGNLKGHASRLEEAGYIRQGRALTPGGFEYRLRITPAGDAAFEAYVAAIRALLPVSDG